MPLNVAVALSQQRLARPGEVVDQEHLLERCGARQPPRLQRFAELVAHRPDQPDRRLVALQELLMREKRRGPAQPVQAGAVGRAEDQRPAAQRLERVAAHDLANPVRRAPKLLRDAAAQHHLDVVGVDELDQVRHLGVGDEDQAVKDEVQRGRAVRRLLELGQPSSQALEELHARTEVAVLVELVGG